MLACPSQTKLSANLTFASADLQFSAEPAYPPSVFDTLVFAILMTTIPTIEGRTGFQFPVKASHPAMG